MQYAAFAYILFSTLQGAIKQLEQGRYRVLSLQKQYNI